ncbi:hypothetical protein [Bradyrhizobium sp. dw_411]|uniref:hypothetical protein n=1 Tax=Bradyrhizobium sp. dw_411 TaxID=2720082 RepID=UPI001BCD53B6|nr:hypothetical protein [Bradyrhizobium sp. dw_411]
MARILIVDDEPAVQVTIPIIVMSGHLMPPDSTSGPDFLTMAPWLGAVRSLQKPFKPVELLATS